MPIERPHFLLYAEAAAVAENRPRWKFVLQSVGTDERLTAADTEPERRSTRLELLAVVRGLEALDQPSRVTLLTRSQYVSRGMQRELSQWRERGWRWERFGQLALIRDHDLWQRIDRALKFHVVECCAWHGDASLTGDAIEAASDEYITGNARHVLPRQPSDQPWRGSIAAALGRLREGVLTPISAIWRPAFTRAA